MKRMLSLLGAAVVALGLALYAAPPANANPVVNGGFETGDFTGWSQFGDTSFSGVQCGGAPEGDCYAFFGPVSSAGGISQDLTLTIGKHYFLTFALAAFGDDPSDFSVSLGGVLLSLSNPVTSGFQTFSFDIIATSALETLSFSFFDAPGFIYLDAVSLAPEPGSIALLAIALAALFMGMRRKSR